MYFDLGKELVERVIEGAEKEHFRQSKVVKEVGKSDVRRPCGRFNPKRRGCNLLYAGGRTEKMRRI